MDHEKILKGLEENGRSVQERDICHLVTLFQDALNLHHWTIKTRIIEDDRMGKSLMKVLPLRDRNLAKIYIRRSLIGKSISEFGPLLLHEMIHLVLDPIVEESSYQIAYEISEGRSTEYNERILRVVERTIEHLTLALGKFIDVPVSVIPELKRTALREIKDELENAKS